MKPAPIKLGYVSSEGRLARPSDRIPFHVESGRHRTPKRHSIIRATNTSSPLRPRERARRSAPRCPRSVSTRSGHRERSERRVLPANSGEATRLGHRVVLLDPFHIIPKARRDSFNLLDICYLRKEDMFAECQTLANNPRRAAAPTSGTGTTTPGT